MGETGGIKMHFSHMRKQTNGLKSALESTYPDQSLLLTKEKHGFFVFNFIARTDQSGPDVEF